MQILFVKYSADNLQQDREELDICIYGLWHAWLCKALRCSVTSPALST